MIVNINTPFPESQKLIVSKILKKKRRKKEKKRKNIFTKLFSCYLKLLSDYKKKPHKSTNIKRQAMLFLQRDDLDNHRFYYISSA